MKKLLMGTAFLTVIGLAITASQFSCTKGSAQSTTTGLTQLNLILFEKYISTGSASAHELWIANIDGSNQKKIPITLSGGQSFVDAKLTPDGKKVVFGVYDPSASFTKCSYIYTCSLDGSNLTKIIDNPSLQTTTIFLVGTY